MTAPIEGWQCSFPRAEQICRDYFRSAAANQTLLKTAQSLKDFAAAYQAADVTTLQNVLSHERDGQKAYVFVGSVTPDGGFDFVGITLMFQLGCHILNANSIASMFAKPDTVRTPEQGLAGIRKELDGLMFTARMLAEMFATVAVVESEPAVTRYIRALGGMYKVNCTPEQKASVESFLSNLDRAYHARLATAGQELRDLAFDPGMMAGNIASHRPCGRPIWIARPNRPGDIVVNQVWIPDLYAKPLLQKMAMAQAVGMAHRPK